jgi:hypothetical protein
MLVIRFLVLFSLQKPLAELLKMRLCCFPISTATIKSITSLERVFSGTRSSKKGFFGRHRHRHHTGSLSILVKCGTSSFIRPFIRSRLARLGKVNDFPEAKQRNYSHAYENNSNSNDAIFIVSSRLVGGVDHTRMQLQY